MTRACTMADAKLNFDRQFAAEIPLCVKGNKQLTIADKATYSCGKHKLSMSASKFKSSSLWRCGLLGNQASRLDDMTFFTSSHELFYDKKTFHKNANAHLMTSTF